MRGFPLFERDPDSGEITFSHHPFTAPAPGQEALFDSDPLAVRAQHYDLVLNGYELGSGSIRNHDPEFQKKVFRRLGMTDEQIEERFGFFVEALRYGAPPHGGMALGHRPHRDAGLRRDQHPRRASRSRRTRWRAT